MPQLQVLQREADPGENQVVSAMDKLNEQLEKRRLADIMKIQNQAELRKAENETDKLKHKEIADAWDFFDKAAEKVGAETAFELTGKNFPDAVMPMLERKADIIKNYGKESAKDKALREKAEAEASYMKESGRGLKQYNDGQGFPSADGSVPPPTAQARAQVMPPPPGAAMSMPDGSVGNVDGQSISQPMPPQVAAMQQEGQPQQIPAPRPDKNYEMRASYGPTGQTLSPVETDEHKIRMAALVKGAELDAELKGGKMSAEEQNVASVAPSALASLDSAINRLSSGKFSQLQNVGIDSKIPWFAGSDIQDVQTHMNNVKSVMNKLMGYGAAFTDSEQKLVSAVTDLNGKTPENIQMGLRFLKDIFQRKIDLVKRGRAAMWDDSKETAFQQEASFMTTALNQKFTKAQINAGLKMIRGGE